MCSCNLKSLAGGSYTMDGILKDGSLTKTITDGNIVSKDCFINGHPLSIFRYLNCAAGKRFTNLFKPYDIEINNDADLINLASIAEKGIDIKQFNANFLQLAKGLTLTEKEIGNAQCILFC